MANLNGVQYVRGNPALGNAVAVVLFGGLLIWFAVDMGLAQRQGHKQAVKAGRLYAEQHQEKRRLEEEALARERAAVQAVVVEAVEASPAPPPLSVGDTCWLDVDLTAILAVERGEVGRALRYEAESIYEPDLTNMRWFAAGGALEIGRWQRLRVVRVEGGYVRVRVETGNKGDWIDREVWTRVDRLTKVKP